MNFCLLIIFFYIWKSVYTEFSYTTEFFTQVVATGGCKIWNSNLIGYLVSIYLASFRWKELRKEKKKKFLSVERCFWPVGTDFTLNLICFSQKSTDNLEITILCLQSYLLFFWAGWNAGIYHLRYILHTKTAHSYRL